MAGRRMCGCVCVIAVGALMLAMRGLDERVVASQQVRQHQDGDSVASTEEDCFKLDIRQPKLPTRSCRDYPFAGPHERKVTYVFAQQDLARLCELAKLGDAQLDAVRRAMDEYQGRVREMAAKYKSQCDAPAAHALEVGKEGNAVQLEEAVLALAQVLEKSGKEADRKMEALAFELEAKLQELLPTEAQRAALRDVWKTWRRQVLMGSQYVKETRVHDLSLPVDLIDLAQQLCSGTDAWFSKRSSNGIAPTTSAEPTRRNTLEALGRAMDDYALQLDTLLGARWAARSQIRAADVSARLGHPEIQVAAESKMAALWMQIHRLTERTRDMVADTLALAGDSAAEQEWRNAVNRALYPSLYGEDSMDLTYEWLMTRECIGQPAKDAIASTYSQSVNAREVVRRRLVSEMLKMVKEGAASLHEVGFYRKDVKDPRFAKLESERREILETTLAEWSKQLSSSQSKILREAVEFVRGRGVGGSQLDL